MTTWAPGPDDTYVIANKCPRCGEVHEVVVPAQGYEEWKKGAHIQSAFPTLTPNQREILITGYDQKCWDEIFSDDEEDDWKDVEGDFDLI